MQNINATERKIWIDNLRWITILIVVIFHVFFYYNNIGVSAMYKGLMPNPPSQGQNAVFTFAGIFQYAVYQWFMLLLFVVSGICAKYTLQKKSMRQFLQSRKQKLLVPSTLGILTIQWISGLLNMLEFQTPEMQTIPLIIKYIICVLTGIGALWFCQVLFVACLLLALIKKLDKNSKMQNLFEKSNILVAVLLYFAMFGFAQVLNVPKINTYRMAYYPMAFILGYYVFSSPKLLLQLKKFFLIFLALGIIFGVVYIKKFYGTYYAEYIVLNNYISILFAWFTTLALLGLSQNILNFNNKVSAYMSKAGWGIYINHIIVLQLINLLLKPIVPSVPIALIYLIELVCGLTFSILLWELLKRIPVIKYLLYGIK